MSGFKDTFTKDDDNKGLGYDDVAFYYFAGSIIFVIAVPWTYSVITNFLFGKNSKDFPKYSADGKEYRYCTSAAMVKKLDDARTEAKKHTTNDTVKFVFKLIILAAVWAGLFYLTQHCASAKDIKAFDPFEILEVEADADNSVIKKAYRKMSLIYHPDKNQGDPVAQAKFIQITKAYEALTDETARANYEKYGNPDGPDASSKVGIGLPQFLLEKDNHVLILCAFFFVLLIFVPTVGICYYNRIKNYMPSGIMVETYEIYRVHGRGAQFNITDARRLKDLPVLLAVSAEARQIPLTPSPDYEKAYKILKKETDFKNQQIPEFMQRNAVLIQAHMERLHEHMTPLMKEELNTLLKHSMKITQEMMGIVKEKSFQSIMWPNAGLGTQWLDAAHAILSFRRCLVQAVSPLKDGEKECELLQIPHFTEEVLRHCKKGKQSKQVSNLSDWLSRAPEDRKGLRDMEQDQLLDMEEFCHHISKVNMQAIIDVEGEEEDVKDVICMGDTATVTVGLTRTNLDPSQAMGPAHAPLFPDPKFEEWWLFVTEANSKKIIAMEVIKDLNHHAEAQMKIPMENPLITGYGKKKLEVHALCDAYLGIDQKVVLDFTVMKPDEVNREEFTHQEDLDLDLQPTLFQQITGLQPEEDSDEEDDDEDNSKKTKKAPAKKDSKSTKKKKDDDSASSSSDDEKEEKEEAAEEEEKSEEKEKSEEPKKSSAKKTKEKAKKDDDSSDDSDSDSGSDNDKAITKKSTGPCGGCVLS